MMSAFLMCKHFRLRNNIFSLLQGRLRLEKVKKKLLIAFFAGQLNDTQQELKENNELVVELQGNVIDQGQLLLHVFSKLPCGLNIVRAINTKEVKNVDLLSTSKLGDSKTIKYKMLTLCCDLVYVVIVS